MVLLAFSLQDQVEKYGAYVGIAAYTGLITMARALGEKKAVPLLQENLAQEQAALAKLVSLAAAAGNGARPRQNTPTRPIILIGRHV